MNGFDMIFLIVTVAWLAEFILFRNRHSTEGESIERGSFPLIFFAIGFTIIVSLVMREWDFWVVSRTMLWWLGLLLYAGGVILRYWGIIHLRDQFTRDVSVKEGDRLVSSGPYQKLRHPLYTGLFFIIIGFCLGLGNVITAILCGGLVTFALLHRIRIEEGMLLEAYGDQYRDWCKTRYRLIPFVY